MLTRLCSPPGTACAARTSVMTRLCSPLGTACAAGQGPTEHVRGSCREGAPRCGGGAHRGGNCGGVGAAPWRRRARGAL
eukprot:356262-Chlamydomonas_euryale.AAC.3